MSSKYKIPAVGAVLLIASLFFYFTVRFTYIERDLIGSHVQTTNRIVGEYRAMEKRAEDENRQLANEDLAAYLKEIHGTYRDIALLAVTDGTLSLRLSSKNDRFIRTTGLFEAILKDFTQEKFAVSKTSPFITRYYDEKTDRGTDQLKFYIFLNRIGGNRLLIVYPYTFGNTILVRTLLEVLLVVALVVILTAALAIVALKRPAAAAGGGGHTIDLGLSGGQAARGDGAVSRVSSNIVSDTLSGYVKDLFETIHAAYSTDSVALYLFHPTGRLFKSMELKGTTFLRINSVSFDTIEIDNDAGNELKQGATMVLDGGSRVVVPLIYNGAFLGTVNITRREGLRGSDVSEIKTGMAGILKNIHDYIMFNDVMSDAATGLHSKIYFNLKYNECLQQWQHNRKNFSLLFILPFGRDVVMGDDEKAGAIRLMAPSITSIVGKDGFLCRYDDYLAVIMPDMNQQKAEARAVQIRDSLSTYRVKTGADSVVRIDPAIGISSADEAGEQGDILAEALKNIHQA